MEFTYKPIGIIHSPHKKAEGTPIQTGGAEGVEARLELFYYTTVIKPEKLNY